MPASPAGSLFASDYSLSAPNTPGTPPPSRPSGSPSPIRALPGLAASPSPSPSHRKQSLEVVFPTAGLGRGPKNSLRGSTGISAPDSPRAVHSVHDVNGLAVELGEIKVSPDAHEDRYTNLPSLSGKTKSGTEDPLDRNPTLDEYRRKSSAKTYASGGLSYQNFEACMEGGLGHETKAGSYSTGTEKAHHHLNRANECFKNALIFKPGNPRAMLARSKVLITLATTYQAPKLATRSLGEAVSLLREIKKVAPKSVSARETLAQACALLSATLHETDDAADDEHKVWEGPIGQLAREALSNLEEVAGDRMDKIREMRQDDAAEQAPSMAETFLALSAASITVSSLATDLGSVDLHVELAEQALDQASNMATVAAAARVKSSTSSANLITRVQLASGRSSLERLRHTFVLGADLDEDDFRSLMSDMTLLATECRERAAKLKGSKAGAASTLAWESVKQLGDAKLLYASLLRLVWRKRRPKRKTSTEKPSVGRKLSARSDGAEPTIQEADEENDPGHSPTLSPNSQVHDQSASRKNSAPMSPSDPRRESSGSTRPGIERQSSNLGAVAEDEAVASFHDLSPTSVRFGSSGSVALPLSGRRGSWLPQGTDGSVSAGRGRRLSSMTAPLVGPDGTSAWSRKASVISLAADDEAQGLVPSSALAKSAWQLLEGAVKQYKLALNLLSGSDLPTAALQRAKTETLTQVAYAALFQASLAPRLALAAEKRTSLLQTAEVYATWAAREVGWSFLIEGTREAALADRRTSSWRADEAGKRAVLLLVRVWWHRAVTTEAMDVETKTAAKDAVEVVVKRMKDREGVREGDAMRFRRWVGALEGEMDQAETLFWRSASRILRGGQGFVLS